LEDNSDGETPILTSQSKLTDTIGVSLQKKNKIYQKKHESLDNIAIKLRSFTFSYFFTLFCFSRISSPFFRLTKNMSTTCHTRKHTLKTQTNQIEEDTMNKLIGGHIMVFIGLYISLKRHLKIHMNFLYTKVRY